MTAHGTYDTRQVESPWHGCLGCGFPFFPMFLSDCSLWMQHLHPWRGQSSTGLWPHSTPAKADTPTQQELCHLPSRGSCGGANTNRCLPSRVQPNSSTIAQMQFMERSTNIFACARCSLRSSNFLTTYVQPGHSCF